jgi:N-acetylglucosaminyldiphosphoundecaprenol N-acetyl-beta-D-mannosaminyltransferase
MNANLNFMGLRIKNMHINEAASYLHIMSQMRKNHATAFVNADCINKFGDIIYTKALKKMDYIFSDGIGMKIGHWMFGQRIVDNVNGTDIFPLLLHKCNKTKSRMFLFGARDYVVKKLIANINKNYPAIEIVGHESGYISKNRKRKMIRKISKLNVDYLFVALGVPLQEKWIANNRTKLNVGVVLGVGGLFDFYSGRIRRAPLFLRNLKLEWLFRLYQEPKRLWKRYIIGNPLFICNVLLEKYKRSKV